MFGRTLGALLCASALASGCLRAGYDEQGLEPGSIDQGGEDGGVPATGSQQLNSDSTPPFAGAITASVTVGAAGAQLEMQRTVAVAPVSLPAAVIAAAAVAVDDQVYIAGGNSDYPTRIGTCQTSVLAYDLAQGSLAQIDTLPVENQGLSLLRHPDGHLYSLMGCCNDSSEEEEKKIYRLELDGTAASHVGSYQQDAYHFASALMAASAQGPHLLVAAAGYGSGPLQDVVQTFDPATGSAAVLSARLPSARCLLAGAAVEEQLYLFGGSTQSSCLWPTPAQLLDEIVAVRLEPEQVAPLAIRMPEPVAGACAVARADGAVLVLGGLRSSGSTPVATQDVYLFDPATSALSRYPLQLPAPRAGMACARSGTGPLVLAGGIDNSGTAMDQLWLFEPFAASGQLVSPLFDAGYDGARWTALSVDADVPPGSALSYRLRVGDDPTLAVEAVDVPADAPFPATLTAGRYAQLTVTFASQTGGRSPILRVATLSYAPDLP